MIQPDPKRLRVLNKATHYDQAMMTAPTLLGRSYWYFRRQFLPYYFVMPPMWRVMLRHLISRDRVVPDFASVGAMRSGTTQLADYIMQHPHIVLPLAKEVGSSTPMGSLLLAQFPTRKQMRAARLKYGTGLTGYCAPVVPSLLFPYIAKNINPSGKVVILLRDPVDRAFAHWRWDQVLMRPVKNDPLWKDFPDFNYLMDLEIETFAEGGYITTGVSGHIGYLRTSIYLPFIKQLRRHFPAENIHYVNATDFFREPAAIAKQVYEFLGLAPYEPVVLPVRNSAPPDVMNERTRERLVQFFAPFNQDLYRFVGRDFGWQ